MWTASSLAARSSFRSSRIFVALERPCWTRRTSMQRRRSTASRLWRRLEPDLALAETFAVRMNRRFARVAAAAFLCACARTDVPKSQAKAIGSGQPANPIHRDTVQAGNDKPTAPASDFRIEPGRAGPIENGMTVDRLYEVVGRESVTLRDLDYEGQFTPAVAIEIPGSGTHPSMIAQLIWRTVRSTATGVTVPACPGFALSQLEVHDARYRTAEGLG